MDKKEGEIARRERAADRTTTRMDFFDYVDFVHFSWFSAAATTSADCNDFDRDMGELFGSVTRVWKAVQPRKRVANADVYFLPRFSVAILSASKSDTDAWQRGFSCLSWTGVGRGLGARAAG